VGCRHQSDINQVAKPRGVDDAEGHHAEARRDETYKSIVEELLDGVRGFASADGKVARDSVQRGAPGLGRHGARLACWRGQAVPRTCIDSWRYVCNLASKGACFFCTCSLIVLDLMVGLHMLVQVFAGRTRLTATGNGARERDPIVFLEMVIRLLVVLARPYVEGVIVPLEV